MTALSLLILPFEGGCCKFSSGVPVDYINVPEGRSIIGGSLSEVRVRVQGQRSDFQKIVESRLQARVDLSDDSAGKQNVALTDKNVSLPSGLRVVSIEPSIIEIPLE
jgi:YbbR domain-containing protein